MFKRTAGFKLASTAFPRSMKVRLAYEYIGSWKREKNPIYEPTWSGLLAVLRQIGLDSLAQNIDSILKKTSPSVEHSDEHKDPENGIISL